MEMTCLRAKFCRVPVRNACGKKKPEIQNTCTRPDHPRRRMHANYCMTQRFLCHSTSLRTTRAIRRNALHPSPYSTAERTVPYKNSDRGNEALSDIFT